MIYFSTWAIFRDDDNKTDKLGSSDTKNSKGNV